MVTDGICTFGSEKMVRKYLRRKGISIDSDYHYYLGKEGLYHILYGDKLKATQVQKANYIWRSLVAQDKKRGIKH